MISRIVKSAALSALGLLAACGDQPEEAPAAQAPTTAGAQGEVLGGSISDEMLPLDTLQSQSPPLVEKSDDGDGDGDDDKGTDIQGTEQAQAEAE